MDQTVSVVLRTSERLDFHLASADLDTLDKRAARDYIMEAFAAADLDVASPTGKILLLDQILLLAQEVKNAEWSDPSPELRKFLVAVCVGLGRAAVTIDLVNNRL